MNTNETETAAASKAEQRERGGFFRRLFGPSKVELLERLADSKEEYNIVRERGIRLVTKARLAEEQGARFEKLYREIAALRNVSWPKPAMRLPESKVLSEFNVPIDQGYSAALHQELDDQLQELLDVVSQAPSDKMTELLRLHLAGGIEHLRLFQKRLLDLSQTALTSDPDLADDKKETKK